MHKQTGVYSYNGLWFNNTNDWDTDTHKNMDESKKKIMLSGRKQINKKDYILHDSSLVKF